MKICSVDLKKLLRDPFFRCDVGNTLMHQKYNFINCYRLAEFITFIETGKPIAREDYSQCSDNVHLLVRNISEGKPLYDDLLYISDQKAEELTNYRIKSGDIIVAISSNCGAAFLYRGERPENVTLSHYLCRLNIDNSKLRSEYLVQYLNSKIMVDYFRGVETGKTQKNLSKVYIHDLPIYLPSVEKQDAICKLIAPLENKITQVKLSAVSHKSIIDKVFQREFAFDYDRFTLLNAKKTFKSNIVDISNNPDLRFSAKFHRDAGEFVMSQLTNLTDKKIKHFISEPIELGASISNDDYSEDGEYYYISMATIKGWRFNSENANTVSQAYSDSKAEKVVRKDDIILARSGEGTIGKVALIEDEDIQGIFCDFTMRIRLKDYNPEFAYYYFRTSYFQYLIEIYKKGLGNNTNIFPTVIQEFPMLDIPLTEQQRIVDEIHSEIAKQDVVKDKIASLRKEIDRIIEETIAECK